MAVLKFIVLLVATAFLVAVLLIAASAYFFPLLGPSVNLGVGRAVFEFRCIGCHSINPNAKTMLGPNLSNIGSVSGTRRPNMSGIDYLTESILTPDAYRAPGASGEMPEGTVDRIRQQDIKSLIAYLASQGASPDYSEISQLQLSGRSTSSTRFLGTDIRPSPKGKKSFSDAVDVVPAIRFTANRAAP